MTSSFIEVSIAEKVDFGEIVYADGHYVRAFTMQSHADYGIKVSFQRTDELDISIQSSNDNLPDGKDMLDPVRDNYIDDLNHINQISELLLAPRDRLRLFITLRMPDIKDEKRQHETNAKRTHKFRNYAASIKVTCVSASEAKMLHSSAIVVTVRACKSMLMIESGDVMFNDCVPGRTFYKDIDVWNMSEAVARFQVQWAPTAPHVRNAAAELQVNSLDTGEIRGEHELQGMQRKTFQLKFSPMRVGHSQGRLELVNVASPLSPASIVVSTFTTSSRTAESDVLVLTTEIDFGNCVTGSSTLRPLRFKNNSGDRISVLLSSDRPKETTFLLEASDDAMSALPMPDAATSSSDVVGSSGSGVGPKLLPPTVDDSTASAGTESRKKDRRVEEVILQPGQEKALSVSFCPALDSSASPLVQQRLQNCDFHISFKVSRRGERDVESENKMVTLRPVRCRASICTSMISVYPTAINLGECLVAMKKTAPVRVTNLSDVPARIRMSLKSKHLSILGSADPVAIPVGGSHEFTLQLQPTTANPDYRKLIWVSNSLNPHNDVTIQVSSSNVDRNRVALHSILYTVSASELFVGTTATTSKMLRSISFRNITAAPICVALCPEIPGTIAIHVPRQFAVATVADDSILPPDIGVLEASIKSGDKPTRTTRAFSSTSNLFARNVPRKPATGQGLATFNGDEQQLARLQSQLDLATPPSRLGRDKKDPAKLPKDFSTSSLKRHARRRTTTLAHIGAVTLNEQGGALGLIPEDKLVAPSRSEIDGIQDASGSELDLDHLLAMYDNHHPSIVPPFFKSCDQERQFVHQQMERLRNSETLLESSCVQVNDIVLPPGLDVPVILAISVENCGLDIGGKLVAVEMAVLVQLLEFDKDLLRRAQEESETLDQGLDMLPQRRIPIHIQQVCVSSMDVSQTHLNFGLIETGSDPKYLKLVLSNCAEVPLLYQIQMSGSFASESISFRSHGDVGVVRPFWTKVVELFVDPKISGAFSEKMMLRNVLNPSDAICVTVKAEVKLRETFSLNASDSIDFGSVIVNSLSNEARITVTNLTSAPRMFTLRQLNQISTGVDSDAPLFNVHFAVQLEKQTGALRQKLSIEEKIEKLEHKLRIAQRKQKVARIMKIKAQIESYRMELTGHIPTTASAASSLTQEDTPPSSDLSDADSMSGSDSESDSESSLSVARKKSVPHFSKEKPYTFEVEGRCSRNVLIRICGSRLGGGLSNVKAPLDGFEEFVQGTIVIHETKNSEVWTRCHNNAYTFEIEPVDKRINYSAVLVHAARSFEDATFPFNPNQPVASTANRSSVLIVEQTPGHLQESKGACVGREVSTIFALRNPSAHTCRIRLSLRSANVLSGEIKNIKCNGNSCVPWQGEVNPMGRRELALTVEPQREGRFDVVFTVQDLTNGGSLTLTWIVHAKTQLHMSRMPPILFPGNTNLIVDFGDCYIDPSPNSSVTSGIPMKKQKLEIRSLEQRVQIVSIKSNLITQVAFFKDESLKENAESFILRAHETITCYVALAQPSHPFVYGEATSRGKASKSNLGKHLMDKLYEYKTGRCRLLNGGITVISRFADEVPGPLDSGFKHEVSLKLTANIGMSIMKVLHPADSFCFIPTIPFFDSIHRFHEHTLCVSNETESLPMRYSITNPHKNDGITVSKPTNDLAPKRQYTHTVKVEQRLGGLSICVIEVSNSSSRQIEFVRITSMSISNPPALDFHDLPSSISKTSAFHSLSVHPHIAAAAVAPPNSPVGPTSKKAFSSRLLLIPPFYSRTDIFPCSSDNLLVATPQEVDVSQVESEYQTAGGLTLADSPQGIFVLTGTGKNYGGLLRPADITTPEALSPPVLPVLITGDIIVKIDSVVVRSVSQAKAALQSILPISNTGVQLVVSRDLKAHEVFISRQKIAAALDSCDASSSSGMALPSFDWLWLKLVWERTPHSIVTLQLKERYAIEERLVAVSKLPIIVSNYSNLDNSDLQESFVSSLNEGLPFIDQLLNSHDMFSAVGLRCNCPQPIIIPPYAAEVQLRITPISPSFNPAHFEGLLLFLRPESLNRSNLKVHASIAGALYVKGSFVDSGVCITPDRIDVGRVGFTNSWSDVPFHFVLGSVNSVVGALIAVPRRTWGVADACVLSQIGISPRPIDTESWDIMCAYRGQVEKLLLGTCASDWFVIDVPAGRTVSISGVLRPSVSKEEGCMGRVSYRIPLFQVFTNTVSELQIHAHVVDVPWVTQRLDLSTGVLKLPPLSIPVAPDSGPCDCWFVVKNQRDSTLTINFRTVVLPPFQELVVFSMLLRSNDTLCESVTLQAGASVEMRLRLRAAKKTSPHNKWPKAALTSSACKICDIELASSEYSETIPVHGQLLCAPTLSVADTEVSLPFHRDERNSRHVRARERLLLRCMREDDVSFKISLESSSASMEQLLQKIVVQPDSGLIKNGEPCEVWLEISAHRNLFQDLDRISSLGTIVITDPDSNETCVRVDLCCMLSDEILSDDEPDDASAGLGGGSSRATDADSHSVSEAGGPDMEDVLSFGNALDGRDDREDSNCYLKLRNCTEIDPGRRYQVNVGQAEMGSESQKWKLSLESNSADPVSWELVQAGPNNGWIRISKTSGSLKNAEDQDSITLTLLAQDIGAYSTYLCIVNKTNPSDIKTVKVLAEVVSPKPSRDVSQSQNLFRIDIDGILASHNGVADSLQRVVHVGDVCYGQRLDAKSFHIVNLSHKLTLEFVLSHSTVHDSSDILFALAETSSEMVRTVFVKPSESLRVFAFLRLRPPAGESQAAVANLRIVAQIKCRLIRDHVEEIIFTGRARSPQFVLTPPIPSKISFSVRSQSITNAQSERGVALQSIELDPPNPWSSSISIPYNASVLLYNPSTIFKVELLKKLSPDMTVESLQDALDVQRLGSSISCVRVGAATTSADDKAHVMFPERGLASVFISVLPSVAAITDSEMWKLLMQQRYIEETAFLYNACDLTEFHVLRVGLSLRDEHTVIPSARNSLAINSLEARVVNVLREFSCIASEYLLKLAAVSSGGSVPATVPLAIGSSGASSIFGSDDDRFAFINIPAASAHAMHVHCLVDELMVLSKKGLHGGIARELAVLLFSGIFSSELAPCFADASKLKFYPLWLCSYVRQLEWFIAAFAEGVADENLDMLRSIFKRSIGRVRPEVCMRQQAQFIHVIFNRNVSSASPKSSTDEKDSVRMFYAHAGTPSAGTAASATAAAAAAAAATAVAGIAPTSDKVSANARSDECSLPTKP